MFTRLAVAALALSLAAPLTFAQTAPKPPDGVELTKTGLAKAGPLRKHCRAEGEGKGLKRAELRKATDECFARFRPDLAKANACRKEAKDKKLDKDATRAHMKECRAKA